MSATSSQSGVLRSLRAKINLALDILLRCFPFLGPEMSAEDVQDFVKKKEEGMVDNARAEKVDEDIAQGEEVLTDGGYGWVCVAGVFLVTAHSWGINTACTLIHFYPL